MDITSEQSVRRRPVNLTIREDVLVMAKQLKLNVSQVAEAGILQAVRAEREVAWKASGKQAIDAHNRRIEQEGVLLPPLWDAP